jgi:hypothetical protein
MSFLRVLEHTVSGLRRNLVNSMSKGDLWSFGFEFASSVLR